MRTSKEDKTGLGLGTWGQNKNPRTHLCKKEKKKIRTERTTKFEWEIEKDQEGGTEGDVESHSKTLPEVRL